MFVVTRLVDAITSPGNFLVLLGLIGAVLLFTRWRRGARWLVLAVALGWLAILLTPLVDFGLRQLEDRFERPDLAALERVDGIVMLGGALITDVSIARDGATTMSTGGRLIEFAALAHRFPEARLVVAGGTGSLRADAPPEADTIRRVLGDLGIEPARIAIDNESRNTYENAVFAKKLTQPAPGETWLLVTSAFHMPRAVGAFRAIDWGTIIAYPVDYKTLPAGGDHGFSVTMVGALEEADLLVHELLGLVYYRLRGLTPTLLPAP